MIDPNLSIPSPDERVMAGLAHISAFLPFMGVIAPIIIWATQRDKSPFVSFQALQAVAYQLSMVMVGFIGMGCYMCSFLGTVVLLPLSSSSNPDAVEPFVGIMLLPLLVMGLMIIGQAVLIIYSLAGAILTFQGKPFHYVIIGKRIERFLQSA